MTDEETLRQRVTNAASTTIRERAKLNRLLENERFLREVAPVVELGARPPLVGWVALQRELAEARASVQQAETAGKAAAQQLEQHLKTETARGSRPSNVIRLKKS